MNVIHELHDQPVPGRRPVHVLGQRKAFSNWVADVAGINLGDGLTGRHLHYVLAGQRSDHRASARTIFTTKDVAGFVEDTWKARPNLTFNTLASATTFS